MARLKMLGSRIPAADLRTARPAPKTALPFYSTPEWRALMATIIRERGRVCQYPAHDPSKPRAGIRVLGDHIQEIQDGGALLDPKNIMLVCFRCHGIKTEKERMKRNAARFQ